MFEDLFRFLLFRPPRAVAPGATVTLPLESTFSQAVVAALPDRNEVQRLSQAWVRSDEFLRSLEPLPWAMILEDALAGAIPSGSVAEFTAWVEAKFGVPVAKLASDGRVQTALQRVLDSLLAIKFARGSFPFGGKLLRAARLLATVDRLTKGTLTDDLLPRQLEALIALPERERPASPIHKRPPPPTHRPAPGGSATEGPSPEALRKVLNELSRAIELRQFVPNPKVVQRLGAAAQPQHATVLFGLKGDAGAPPDLVVTGGDAGPFVLSEQGRNALSVETRTLLGSLGLDLASRGAPELANRVHQELVASRKNRTRELLYFRDGVPQFQFLPFYLPPFLYSPFIASPIPTSTGHVQPAGVGDLLVIRQQIVRYEPTEVSAIDNLPRGSLRSHHQRRLDVSEELFLGETERTEETETEQSVSDRFELKQETQRTIREDAALKAGVTVSASYGPTVEFTASVEASYERSTEEAQRRAVEYGRDVVDRSASRLMERKLSRHEQRFRREVEQRWKDERDNREGSEHLRGVFQFVDKVYEAQVFNYGKRLMFDFVVPEPAALLRHALARGKTSTLPPPVEPLEVTAAQIDETTYMELGAQYGATDLRPPPEPYRTVSVTFAKVLEGGVDGKRIAEEKTIEIPPGYEASECHVDIGLSRGGAWWFDVWVGQNKYQNKHDRETFDRGRKALPYEVGTLPIGVHAGNVNAYTVVAEVVCVASQTAKVQWQLETYEKIREAYELRLRETEEALALAETGPAGVVGAGQNPATNRATEKSELKRGCISLLGAHRFEHFDAVRQLPGLATDYPELEFSEAEAEGAYIRFFEHAFEWEQMTYVLYPYFWSRKPQWLDRLLDRDTDPQFAEFIKAGAARVQLPVRPGFEEAVLFFNDTGRVWSGSDGPPPIGDPLYHALVDEIRERTHGGPAPLPTGEPWPVRVPTELTWLRTSATLPSWTRNPDGTYSPDGGA